MPTANVNGITLNYLLEGDGPETIVLVNGLADALESWDFQVPALLEAGLRVLRFDNRGIGRHYARRRWDRHRHRRCRGGCFTEHRVEARVPVVERRRPVVAASARWLLFVGSHPSPPSQVLL